MAKDCRLTVACGDYEIVRALKEGAVEADGLDLVMLTGMGPRERHWRMARKAEFDVCEANVGAYFMARDQGEPITAIPVFLHRRFRHGFVFVNADAGIREPKDLIGKKVGGTNFQPAGQHLDARHSGGAVRRCRTARSPGWSSAARTSPSRRPRICASR